VTEIIHPPLDNLEDRLGDALGVALGMLRHPETLTNASMAMVEKAFLEWCDKQIDGLGAEAPETVNPEDIGIFLELDNDD
jgi:hypothetical protein